MNKIKLIIALMVAVIAPFLLVSSARAVGPTTVNVWACAPSSNVHPTYSTPGLAQAQAFNYIDQGAKHPGENIARVRVDDSDVGLMGSWNFKGQCGNQNSGGQDIIGNGNSGNQIATVVKCNGDRTDRYFGWIGDASQQAIDSEMNGENNPGSVKWVGTTFADGSESGRYFLGLC